MILRWEYPNGSPFHYCFVCLVDSSNCETTIAVTKFVRDVRGARSDLDAVSRELLSLNTVLELLAEDVANSENGTFPAALQKQITGIITNCTAVVVEIQVVLDKHEGTKIMKAAKWVAFGNEDMNKLRSSLEAHKSALEIALDMIALTLAREIKADTSEILQDTSAIKDQMTADTDKIIAEIVRLQGQLPREAGQGNVNGFMLDRYLNNLTSYAETVAEGISTPPGEASRQGSSRSSLEIDRKPFATSLDLRFRDYSEQQTQNPLFTTQNQDADYYSKPSKNNKRRTVQVEYVAPRSQTRSGESQTITAPLFTTHFADSVPTSHTLDNVDGTHLDFIPTHRPHYQDFIERFRSQYLTSSGDTNTAPIISDAKAESSLRPINQDTSTISQAYQKPYLHLNGDIPDGLHGNNPPVQFADDDRSEPSTEVSKPEAFSQHRPGKAKWEAHQSRYQTETQQAEMNLNEQIAPSTYISTSQPYPAVSNFSFIAEASFAVSAMDKQTNLDKGKGKQSDLKNEVQTLWPNTPAQGHEYAVPDSPIQTSASPEIAIALLKGGTPKKRQPPVKKYRERFGDEMLPESDRNAQENSLSDEIEDVPGKVNVGLLRADSKKILNTISTQSEATTQIVVSKYPIASHDAAGIPNYTRRKGYTGKDHKWNYVTYSAIACLPSDFHNTAFQLCHYQQMPGGKPRVLFLISLTRRYDWGAPLMQTLESMNQSLGKLSRTDDKRWSDCNVAIISSRNTGTDLYETGLTETIHDHATINGKTLTANFFETTSFFKASHRNSMDMIFVEPPEPSLTAKIEARSDDGWREAFIRKFKPVLSVDVMVGTVVRPNTLKHICNQATISRNDLNRITECVVYKEGILDTMNSVAMGLLRPNAR